MDKPLSLRYNPNGDGVLAVRASARDARLFVRALNDPRTLIQAAINVSKAFMRSRVYSGHLPERLSNKLNELADLPQRDRYSLDTEIDIARLVVADSLTVYEAAMQEGSSPETRVMAAVQARTALEFLNREIERAARLRIDRGDALSDECREQIIEELSERLRKEQSLDAALSALRAQPAPVSSRRVTVTIK